MTTKTRLARLEKARADARRGRLRRRSVEEYTDDELETAIRDGVLQFCPEAELTDDLLQAIAMTDFSHPVIDAALRRAAVALGLTPPAVMDAAFIHAAGLRAHEVLGEHTW